MNERRLEARFKDMDRKIERNEGPKMVPEEFGLTRSPE
jgi:hypothetical protein